MSLGRGGRLGSRRDRGAGHGRIALEPRKANSSHFTGFGRTGEWFALKRYGVKHDILAFAKGVTSGYLPLDGIMVSRPILDAMTSVPYGDRWIHACTYSGHPTCCAVGLRNLEILEKEGLVENAAKTGARLLAGRGLRLCCRRGCDRKERRLDGRRRPAFLRFGDKEGGDRD